MQRHAIIWWCLLTLIVVLLFLPATLAEQPVKAMSFFDEPLTLQAVPGKQRHLLAVLPQPDISSPVYALKGMVRYDGVEGDAYLQMNNDFGEMGVFFTKSLAPSGPLGKITGTAGWRPFILPFYANRGDQAGDGLLTPIELTLALHLPGSGSVALRDVRLYQYANDEDPLAGEHEAPRTTGRSSTLFLVFGLLFAVGLGVLIARSRGGR